jgi:putative DNA methylase
MRVEPDVQLVETLARRESYNRHLYRPNAYLHKWWARRCGTTFRWILKTLVPDPACRAFEAPGGLEGLIVLDPMVGGGTTLYEALRMGASVVGMDVDPIPILMTRAALCKISIEDLRRSFHKLWDLLREEFEGLWQTSCPYCGRSVPLRFTLYGRERFCRCGTFLFVDTAVLRQEGKRVAFQLTPEGSVRDARGRECFPALRRILRTREEPVCRMCGQPFQDPLDRPFRDRYVPVAVCGKCPKHGLFFAPPRREDLQLLERATEALWRTGWENPEEFIIRPGPKSSDLLRAGVRSYLELFSARQLLLLSRAVRLVRETQDPPTRLHLALLISTSLDFNSMLCGYKGHDPRRPGAVRHVFAHHAYSIPYTALENNPLYPEPASGTWLHLFQRMEKGKRWALRPEEVFPGNGWRGVPVPGEQAVGEEVFTPEDLVRGPRRFWIIHGSATKIPLPDQFVDLVVTDPPYYNNVQYGDLAMFFRVWLRQMLPDEIRWEWDLSDEAAESAAHDPIRYADIMGQIFTECRRVLKPGGHMTLTFHHWRPEAWAALTVALRRGGFRLLRFFVVHSENLSSVHISGQHALVHDAILFLTQNPLESLKLPLPEKIQASESREFVAQCATALGALLDKGMPEEDIWNWWRTAFRLSSS